MRLNVMRDTRLVRHRHELLINRRCINVCQSLTWHLLIDVVSIGVIWQQSSSVFHLLLLLEIAVISDVTNDLGRITCAAAEKSAINLRQSSFLTGSTHVSEPFPGRRRLASPFLFASRSLRGT